jgi:predicted Zn finger-like uncharacterized protein
MITYCPSCHTHFRVHSEQLAARAGQVRCGKCSRVFDALEHLIEETAPALAHRPNPAFEATPADAVDVESAPELAAREAPDIGAIAQKPVTAQAADVVAEAPDPGAETPEAAIFLESAIAEPANAEPVTTSGASAFSFGSVASAEPATPMRRWPWLLGVLLLLLTLLAQATYRYRSAVTLLFPETKPYAIALCASLGCELPLPRRIEMMSIEASDLQADTTNPNVMVLSATIKNRAIFNQQHPLLELTLTDTQDRPVVRRVLAPQDYLGKAVNTQAGFAANAEIAIKVFVEGSQVKATGYRLYLFYP